MLDRDGCVRGGAGACSTCATRLSGGLLTPKDETGDCFKFTSALAAKAEAARRPLLPAGTDDQRRWMSRPAGCAGVVTDSGAARSAEAVVVALGSYSPLLLKPLRHQAARLSRSRATRSPSRLPMPRARRNRPIIDETYKIAITRLGDRIRVGGMAEISGYTNDLGQARRQHARTYRHGPLARRRCKQGFTLVRVAPDDAGRNAGHRPHQNCRPLPQYRARHAWLDDQLSGSARVIADLVSDRRPEIDAVDLTAISRYT